MPNPFMTGGGMGMSPQMPTMGWQNKPNVGTWQPGQGAPPWAQGQGGDQGMAPAGPQAGPQGWGNAGWANQPNVGDWQPGSGMPPWAPGQAQQGGFTAQSGSAAPGQSMMPQQASQQAASALAGMGQSGDTMLAHLGPQEMGMLRAMGGQGTRNPMTGLPQFATNPNTPALVPIMSQGSPDLTGGGLGVVPSWALNPYQIGMRPSSFPVPNQGMPGGTGGGAPPPGSPGAGGAGTPSQPRPYTPGTPMLQTSPWNTRLPATTASGMSPADLQAKLQAMFPGATMFYPSRFLAGGGPGGAGAYGGYGGAYAGGSGGSFVGHTPGGSTM